MGHCQREHILNFTSIWLRALWKSVELNTPWSVIKSCGDVRFSKPVKRNRTKAYPYRKPTDTTPRHIDLLLFLLGWLAAVRISIQSIKISQSTIGRAGYHHTSTNDAETLRANYPLISSVKELSHLIASQFHRIDRWLLSVEFYVSRLHRSLLGFPVGFSQQSSWHQQKGGFQIPSILNMNQISTVDNSWDEYWTKLRNLV